MSRQPQSDHDSAAYWEAAREGRLVLQCCTDCETVRFPPRDVCWACLCTRYEWREHPGLGTVASWTVAERAFDPAFADLVPYIVVLVRLDGTPDILVFGRYLGDRAALHVGARVEARVERSGTEAGLVNWRAPAAAEGSAAR